MKLFISYSHEDEHLKDQLIKHLSSLRRENIIDSWNDKQLLPGEKWDEEIKNALYSCNLVLLLVSPDFLSSDYIQNTELKISFERYNNSEIKITPIILRPCHWKDSPIGELIALPRDAKPITTWNNIDEGFLSAIQGLLRIIKSKEPFSNKDVPKKKNEKLSNINIGSIKGNAVFNNAKKIKQTINFDTKK